MKRIETGQELLEVLRALAFAIDTTKVEDSLQTLGYDVRVSDIDTAYEDFKFTVEGGENETGFIATLALKSVEMDSGVVHIGGDVADEFRLERERQIELGYTPEHDDERGIEHVLAQAMKRLPHVVEFIAGEGSIYVPTREDLVVAGSVLMAAIELIDRFEDSLEERVTDVE